MELCLKAILEADGRLAETLNDGEPDGKPPEWKTHSPVKLFKLLGSDEQQQLKRWWNARSKEERHFERGYLDFLESVDDLYSGLRYLQRDLKDANPQVEIASLLSASRLALEVARDLFRRRSPFKVEITTQVSSDPTRAKMHEVIVQGVVRSATVPDGFDPHGRVEVVIDTDDGQEVVTDLFRKAAVEDYHRIEGDRVIINGYATDEEPLIIRHSRCLSRSGPNQHKRTYYRERRILSGSIYNLETYEVGRGQQAVRLTLDDATFLSKVECIFSTKEEQVQLADVHLGQQILISGEVSLK